MNYKRLFIPNTLIFITMVTNKRLPILINNIDLLKEAYHNVSMFYKFDIIAYSILEDHIHFIMKPDSIELYPKIIKSFKYSVTKKLANDEKIWQSKYWEHTIKNEKDLNMHLDYIHFNSTKHYNIAPKDWEFSSFNNFVKNKFYDEDWCNIGDVNKINQLNFE